jgi:hypothetical protein
VDNALRGGHRGLMSGSSLARLLAEHRGVRNVMALPPLTVAQILGWADEFHEHTGRWPTSHSGPITNSGGETWGSVNFHLTEGRRGLPGGCTLADVLARHHGGRNKQAAPKLTRREILAWADAHYARTGQWPTPSSGQVREAPDETWTAIDLALHRGTRGLTKGGSSLRKLLAKHRGVRHRGTLPHLTVAKILRWADAHHRRTGRWPAVKSGPIPASGGETWTAVDSALRVGIRGLPGGSSIAQLLEQHRNVRNVNQPPHLTLHQILAWADAHHAHTGRWPIRDSGRVREAPEETWTGIDLALRRGSRGLILDGSSLAKLLAKYRGVPNRLDQSELSIEQILHWADVHFRRTGRWPNQHAGPVLDAPGEKWGNIDAALAAGRRGLPPGGSLVQLLAEHRGRMPKTRLPMRH